MSKTNGNTATLVSMWTVQLDGATIHEGTDFADALAARRKHGGKIVRVDFDASPGAR